MSWELIPPAELNLAENHEAGDFAPPALASEAGSDSTQQSTTDSVSPVPLVHLVSLGICVCPIGTAYQPALVVVVVARPKTEAFIPLEKPPVIERWPEGALSYPVVFTMNNQLFCGPESINTPGGDDKTTSAYSLYPYMIEPNRRRQHSFLGSRTRLEN
ncbi:hypothetical protein GLAREA_10977 [Glarea lozoyensis ATCC 20868]|uniref:Uncharacterized protein n=2 Tax=Glarea lozoyensis TaxID=101852 RepID=S3EAF5_GLAL2|nr:uncharacterized protein GLAREA_10977 [Glarea lozoyensis ATCC 20868]EHL01087.1 hypothetical protein M7I_2948 [Glarea lozoyensis 74030]EPE35278.1 hypothetical protein GLAREA_10977 [Glarea lozoyensis ATCC 20868]